MDIRIFDSSRELAFFAADIFAELIRKKPDCVLGLATGATPLETYARLITLYEEGGLDFSQVRTFNLDEYLGLPVTDPNSYRYFMDSNFFSKVNIAPENTHVPDGNAADAEQMCSEYDRSIQASGGIDLQLLGIGRNAHIAFNEPGSDFSAGTHTVRLTESTIEANRIYFTESEMPRFAVTMGIGSIMKAKKILLLAVGDKKAQAVRDTVKGPVTPEVPASVLQNHPDCLILCDKAAASLL
ncbi:MAG: glucosamine-6-phosphate deaminase [Clostridia bacterium]|nr:glucosamine-6-phosphate deaminase [Clostridia bacterium]